MRENSVYTFADPGHVIEILTKKYLDNYKQNVTTISWECFNTVTLDAGY